MKKINFALFVILMLFSTVLFFACKSTDVVAPEKESPVADESSVTKKNEAEESSEDEGYAEYSRSTQDVAVPRDVFSIDKNAILKIISSLSKIIEEYNYEDWLKYIEPASIRYWSNKHNLAQASKRLPIKGQVLNNLYDYFRLVFVPSRKGRNVDEIRYISLDQVKAVQMREDQDIVYYNFVKVNGKWMVKLPSLAISGK